MKLLTFMPLLLIAFLPPFLALPIHAGVQGVGKGGGYGEMQAYSANLKMMNLVSACVTRPSTCKLTTDQAVIVRRVSIEPFQISFDPTCKQDGIAILSRAQARINSCDLYHPGPTFEVKPFSEIAHLVLQARLMGLKGLAESQALQMAHLVFDGMTQETQSLMTDMPSGNYFFHVMQFSTHGSRETLVSVEGKTITIDISKDIEALFGCSVRTARIELKHSEMITENQILYHSTVDWVCQKGEHWTGSLQVSFIGLPNGEVNAQSVRVRLIGKIPR